MTGRGRKRKLLDGPRSEPGSSPGTLAHVADRPAGAAEIWLFNYSPELLEERHLKHLSDCKPYLEKQALTWINLSGAKDVKLLTELGEIFQIHPLVLEDIVNTRQRPKVEDYGKYIFIVVRMLHSDLATNEMISEQVSLIVGESFVISIQDDYEGDVFNPVRDRIRSGKGRIRKSPPDYLAYALVDAIVDNYFVLLESLDERIEELDEAVVNRPSALIIKDVHFLKRELIEIRKSVWPLREVIATLERGELDLIHEGTGVYLRDLHDHTIQVIDTIETFRDMLSGLLEIYLTSVSNRMNEIMKVLTIISTIFIPLTFIVGVYGMNFHHMPELDSKWGYPLVWVFMIAVAGLMIGFFRRKKWI